MPPSEAQVRELFRHLESGDADAIVRSHQRWWQSLWTVVAADVGAIRRANQHDRTPWRR